ncbi:MAG TPA: hypothetical protein VLY86_00250 [Methanothrix sp.]|nr:hypothetical protein [Methanothrix sp.]
MKALAVLALFILAAILSGAVGEEPGPHLEVSSISGKMDSGRPSVLSIVISNSAPASIKAEEFKVGEEDALCVIAELFSSDDRIRVLTDRQVLGALPPGTNRSAEFTVLAEGKDVGICALQLHLSYSQLTQTEVSGDPDAPDVSFHYENSTLDLPVQADLVLGPKAELNEVSGVAHPGEMSELQMRFVNEGDELVTDLQVDVRPQQPFEMVETSMEGARLDPGGSANLELKVLADANASEGWYALPYRISFTGGSLKGAGEEELSALVRVQKETYPGWLLSLAAAVLLVIGGLSAVRHLKRGKRRRNLRG